jgi:hypothetical protein
MSGFALVIIANNFCYHDFVWLTLAVCIILLYNHIRTEFWKPCVNPEPVWGLESCQWFEEISLDVYLPQIPRHLISQVKVTLRLTVSQSVSLGFELHLGLMTRYLLFDSYGLVFVGLPLWREDGSYICIRDWSLPAHSFSGPSPLGLATIFYCPRFETSLFVAFYGSQGHAGGIRPRLHTGF